MKPATQPPAPSPAQQPRVASSKPVAVPMAPPAPAAPAVNLTVNFANGSADLTPDAIRTLDALGRALASQDLAGYRFRIEGHTDTVGSSRLQSRTVRAARRSGGGLRRKEVRRRSEPACRPSAWAKRACWWRRPPQTPEPRNRRVQVINLGA